MPIERVGVAGDVSLPSKDGSLNQRDYKEHVGAGSFPHGTA